MVGYVYWFWDYLTSIPTGQAVIYVLIVCVVIILLINVILCISEKINKWGDGLKEVEADIVAQLNKPISQYRNLILSYANNPAVLAELRKAGDGTELPLTIMTKYTPVWNNLERGLIRIIDTLDKIIGNEAPRFRYEFITKVWRAKRFIVDPTTCIDYVYFHYKSISAIDRQMAAIPNIQTQLQQKIIKNLREQEKTSLSKIKILSGD